MNRLARRAVYCVLFAAAVAGLVELYAQRGVPAAVLTYNGKVSATMANPAIPAQPLSADLVPRIGEAGINMLLVRLVRLDPNMTSEDGLQVEIGPAWFLVADVLAGTAFTRGETIAVPIKRIRDVTIRSRNPVNHWNNLSLEPGSVLAMACTSRQGEFCHPRAALEIRSANAADVDLIRRAYGIENQKSEAHKVIPLVAAALARPPDLLFTYALDFIGRRNALGRQEGALLAAKALAHPAVPRDSKFEIASHVATRSRFFDPAQKTDTANVAIIAGLVSGLVSEPDPAQQLDWMRYIGSMVLGDIAPRAQDADALRRELVRAVRTPEPAQVMQTLQKLRAASQTDQDKETSSELLEVWQSAFRR